MERCHKLSRDSVTRM